MYDVIVIGVGTMGAAACDCLARRGVKVLGIDRFSPPHDRGSHHGDTRMFRMAYYEHSDYVPLLKRSRELWLELNCAEPLPRTVYHEVGGLYMGPADGELFAGSSSTSSFLAICAPLSSTRSIIRAMASSAITSPAHGSYNPM